MFRCSLFALPALVPGFILLGTSSSAEAACVREGNTVTCAEQDTNGYVSPSSNGLALTVAPGATLYNINNGEFGGECDELALPSVWLGDDSAVTNGGAIVTQGVCGWGIALGDRGAVINRGQIGTYGVLGVGVLAGDGLTAVNSGGITTRDQSAYGLYVGSQATITNETGGFILTEGDGASAIVTQGRAVIDNRGRIETRASASDAINATAGVTLRNAGEILARGSSSSAVKLTGGEAMIVNSGQISTLFAGQTNAPTHAVGVSGDVNSISLTNSGVISGAFAAAELTAAGQITIVNTGLMTMTGQRRTDGSLLAGGAVIMAGARGNSITITNSGEITATNGQSAVRIDGNGVLHGSSTGLSNTGVITGDIIFAAGDDTLQLGTGGRLIGTLDGGLGSDTLLLTGNGDFSGPIARVENLSKSGAGTWTLHRALTFSRQANILDGVLKVDRDGAVTTPALNVITSGTLAGSGTIAGTVSNAGTLAPGMGASTPTMLSILGAYVQDAAGTLALNASPASNDSLYIGGTATLGGTLRITYDPALAASHFSGARERRIIFAADRGLTVQGDFARVVSNAPFLDTRVRTSATGVDVVYTRISYGAAAGNPNQRAAGEMLDRLAGAPALAGIVSALDAGTPDSAVGILAALTPETVPALQNLGLFTLQSLRDAPPRTMNGTYAAWGAFLNRHGSADRPGAAAYRYDLNGGVAGFSLKAGEALRLSALLAHSSADAAFTSPATGKLSGNFAGLGLSYGWETLTATAGVIYGTSHPETRRTQTLPSGTSALSARGSANMWSVYGSLATTFDLGAIVLTPHATLARDSVDLGRFDETAPLSATVLPSDATSLRAELGLRADAKVGDVRPYLGLRTAKELLSGRRAVVVQITGVPDSDFTISGQRTRGLAMSLDGGLAMDIAPRLEAHAGARFTANDVFAGRSVAAGLTYRW